MWRRWIVTTALATVMLVLAMSTHAADGCTGKGRRSSAGVHAVVFADGSRILVLVTSAGTPERWYAWDAGTGVVAISVGGRLVATGVCGPTGRISSIRRLPMATDPNRDRAVDHVLARDCKALRSRRVPGSSFFVEVAAGARRTRPSGGGRAEHEEDLAQQPPSRLRLVSRRALSAQLEKGANPDDEDKQ